MPWLKLDPWTTSQQQLKQTYAGGSISFTPGMGSHSSLLPSHIHTNALGFWGCCGTHCEYRWLQLPYIASCGSLLGTSMEVLCHSDNTIIVYWLTKAQLTDAITACFLFFFYAAFNLTTEQHIHGALTVTHQYALSQNNLVVFSSLHSQASPLPTSLVLLSQDFCNLALTTAQLWTSPDWTRLFNAILDNQLYHPLSHCTVQPTTDISFILYFIKHFPVPH